jgi:ACR3 family arsenite transporter
VGLFERYLSVWVGRCIVAGVLLGTVFPGLFHWFAALEVAHVNIPVAIFIWLMIYPMMVQVDFASIREIGKKPKGLLLTLVMNWLVKPFTMPALGWLFFRVIFADLVDPHSRGRSTT